MAQLLAIDWDAREIRFVLATAAGGHLRIRAAGAADLPEAALEDRSRPSLAGQTLRAALAACRAGRCSTLVGLPRSEFEFLSLTLPPAKDTELPELVGHGVLRQLPHLGEDATIDFLTLNESADAPREVLAAVCPAETLQRVAQCCEAAGLSASRLLVRPFALASWLRQVEDVGQQVCLMACQVGQDLDLAVVAGQRVLYSRTVRLPEHEEAASLQAWLLAEIQRTLLVAPQGGLAPGPIERVILFGAADELGPLTERIQRELSLPAMAIDPLASADLPAADRPDDPGRFAPLVGMLQDESPHRHPLDFLHPRKPPAPPNRRRQLTLAAAAAAVVVLLGSVYVWDALGSLDAQNEELAGRLRELDQSLKKASVSRNVVQSIESWESACVNWLDELRDISFRFPSSRDAVMLRLSLSTAREGGGEIEFSGLVRDPAIVFRLENSIRDDFHQMRSPRVQEREQDKDYTWHFESRVLVKPRTREQYVAHFGGDETPPAERTADSKAKKAQPVAARSPATSTSRENGSAQGVPE